MIQRIQSLFLLGAALCFGVACFMPIGMVNVREMSFIYSPWVLMQDNLTVVIQQTYYVGLSLVILAATSFAAIFFYKNRTLQSKICTAAIIISFILLILMLYVYPDVVFPKLLDVDKVNIEYYGKGQFPWVFLSFIPLIFLYLANKFILKDEKKVRAADRLR